MEILELVLWISVTFVLVKFSDAPIYEYLQDMKQNIDIYYGNYNIDSWEELSE